MPAVAVTQIRTPGTVGRIYFERKGAEGKSSPVEGLGATPLGLFA